MKNAPTLPFEPELDRCQIPQALAMLFSGGNGGVAYLGGSVTQGRGASNTAETSWRALFQKYLMQYHRRYYAHVGAIVSGLGGCNSPIAAFFVQRNVLFAKPALTFVEFCLNDRHVPDALLAAKGIEGVVRQLVMAEERCDVVLLGAGCNPRGITPDGHRGPVDHGLHRKIAAHYDLPFFDLQAYLYDQLEQRGQTWEEHIVPKIEYDPNYHLNDYGQGLYCDAICQDFEGQIRRFQAADGQLSYPPMPEPLFSDELQYVKLINPARDRRSVSLEGQWETKPEGLVPWYCDSVLMGKPGAKLRLQFTGTAIMVWALVSYNGLNVRATLDGTEVSGMYLRYTLEFGRGFVLAHGLPCAKHVLELTVDEPSKRQHKLEYPCAQVAYLGIANKPGGSGRS